MTADDGDNFVSRWSRLKKQSRQTEKAPEPGPGAASAVPAAPVAGAPAVPQESVPPKGEAPSGAGVQSAVAATQLPPLDSLKGLASEYTEFLKPGVDENLRRSALKKLFSDPRFENFERFEAYCED